MMEDWSLLNNFNDLIQTSLFRFADLETLDVLYLQIYTRNTLAIPFTKSPLK